jgi:long-chain acyl-CoA synthetase
MSYEDIVKTTTLKIKRHIEQEKISGLLNKAGVDIRKITGMVIDEFSAIT